MQCLLFYHVSLKITLNLSPIKILLINLNWRDSYSGSAAISTLKVEISISKAYRNKSMFIIINIIAVVFPSTVSVYKINILLLLLLDTEPMFVADTELLKIYNFGVLSDFDAKTTVAYHHLLFK